ncbi:MAG: ATP-binding protein [Planctomycetota bacterium]
MPHDAQRIATSAQWLAQLRWVAVFGQLVTVGVVAGPLGVELPVRTLLVMIAVTAGTNAAFWWAIRKRAFSRSTRRQRNTLGALMLLDLAVLTGMLGVTGGTNNPFAVFYFVNLALCGVLLRPKWAWFLAGMTVVAFGGLRCVHVPMDELTPPGVADPTAWRLVDAGLLVAFTACAAVIVWFATRLTSELARSESARRRVEDLRARSEKLEALGTLAAGAAHELATPLSTIAVVAKELERELALGDASAETVADIELIRSEVDRCRTILDRMSMRTGEAPGEAPAEMPVGELLEEVLAGLGDRRRVELAYEYATAAATMTCPRTALAQALRAIVQNGLDASAATEGAAAVRVVVGPALGGVEVAVHDRGPGMPAEVLQRAGEPFFTTKSPGEGMGLGLFLARSVIERVGGELRLESQPGEGATVRVILPARFRAPADPVPRDPPPDDPAPAITQDTDTQDADQYAPLARGVES